MSEHPNGWNRRLVQALPCGCVVQVTTYEAIPEERRAALAIEALERGLVVSLVAWGDRAAQSHHCADYPHEDWQRAYVARLEAFGNAR